MLSQEQRINKKKEILEVFQRELGEYVKKNGYDPVFTNGGLSISLFVRKKTMFGLSHSDNEILKFNFFENTQEYNFTPTSSKYMELEKDFMSKSEQLNGIKNYGLSSFINDKMKKYGFHKK